MKNKLYTLLILLLCGTSVFGQVTFTAVDVFSCTDSGTAVMDFTINTDENLGAFQFAVIWDTNVLDNAVLEDVSLGNSYDSADGATITDGELRVGWFNAGNDGIFAPDQVLFRLTFDHVSGSANTAIVDITDLPGYQVLVARDDFSNIPADQITLDDGTMSFTDTESPVINNCPADITVTVPFGSSGGAATWADVDATDNCTTPVLTNSHNSGDTFPLGTTAVTITASDAMNNVSAPCEFTVTVEEEANPDPFVISISDEETGCEDLTVTFDFTTDNFTNMSATQYGITWNPAVLEYVGNSDVFSGVNNFNESEAANGELRVGWFDGNGFTLPDGSLLYRLTFNFLGATGQTANIQIAALSDYPIIFVNQNGQIDAANYTLNPGSAVRVQNNPPTFTDCPANLTVDNDAGICGAVVNFALPTVNEDCDADIEILQTSTLGSGDTFAVGTETVTYEATDNVNQTATCTFTVTVNDAEAPVVSDCPANITLAAPAGECAATATWTPPTATDNCGTVTLTSSHAPGDSFPVGDPTDVVYSATDDAGQTTVCAFMITVIDDESPVFSGCLEDISQPTDSDACTTSVTWTAPTATDNCGNVTVTTNISPDTDFALGTTQVTYTATDDVNNSSFCSFNVTVFDNVFPQITCPDDTAVQPTDDCEGIATWTAPTPTDNCTIATFSSTHDSGDIFPAGTTTVTYTTSDGANNESTCSFDVTVEAVNNLIFGACPPDQTGDAGAECSATATWTPPTAMNTCNGEPTLSSNYNPGDDFPLGSTVVVYTAENADGQTASCSFTVTITGTGEVILSDCPADITVTAVPGADSATASWTPPTATNSCDGSTVTANGTHAPGDAFPIGTTEVTYSTSDADGNVISCSFNVTVEAGAEPVDPLICPENVTVNTNPGLCSAVTGDLSAMTADSITTLTYELDGAMVGSGNGQLIGMTFVEGETTVTYTAGTDAGSTFTCSFTVTVTDAENPVLTCPADIDIELPEGETETPVTWDLATVTDNCSTALTPTSDSISGNVYALGLYQITFTATDEAGNDGTCVFSLNIETEENTGGNDCTAAAGTLALAQVNYLLDETTGTVTVTGTDNDDSTVPTDYEVIYVLTTGADFTIAALTTDNPEFTIDAEGDYAMHILVAETSDSNSDDFLDLSVIEIDTTTAADVVALINGSDICAALNANGTPFTVSAEANEDCTIEFTDCPTTIVQTTDTGICGAAVEWEVPGVTGDCNYVIFEPEFSPGDTLPVGNTTLTYVLTDENNNSTGCTFTITVTDDEMPTVDFCPAPITVGNMAGECQASVVWMEPQFSDNCAITQNNATHDNGDIFTVGSHLVIYTASDAAGNTVTCNINITVEDNEMPVILNVPNDIIVDTDAGECGAIVAFAAPSYFDNCQITNSFCSRTSGEFFDKGTTTVTCTAFDEAGNMTTETFTITVVDNEAPEFACSSPVAVNADGTIISDPSNILDGVSNAGCNEIEINFTLPEATDACSPPVTVTQTAGVFQNGDVFPVGMHILEYTATDFDNNDKVCTLNITVEEEAGPQIAPDFENGLCEGTSGKLCVDATAGSTFAWFSPQGELVSSLNCAEIDNANEADAGEYSVNIISPSGCVTQSTYNLIIFSDAQLVVEVEPILCATGEENLEFTVTDVENTNVQSYDWTGPNSLTSNVQNLVVPNVGTQSAGIYELTVVNANGCTTQVSTEAIVTEAPDAPGITTATQLICVGETAILNANTDAPANATYTWTATPPEGAGLPAMSDSPQITVAPTTGANVTYFLTVTTDGCVSEPGNLTLIQESAPTTSIEAEGDNLCVTGDEDFTLTETGGEAAAWNWTGPNGFSATGSSITLSGLTAADAGSYTVTAASSIGCETAASYQLNVTEVPTGLTAAFADAELCENESATLQISGFTGNGVTYIYNDGNADVTTTNTTVNLGLFDAANYSYTVTATADGCTSEPTEATLSVQAAPTANITQTGDENCVEDGTTVTLTGGGDAATYTWQRNGNSTVISDASALTFENIDENDSGIYTLTAASSFGCTTTVSEELTVSEAVEPVSVNFSNDGCMGEVLQLQAEDDNVGLSYRWLLDGTVRYTEQNPTIDFLSATDAGDYQVIAFDPESGCADTSEVRKLNILTEPITAPDMAFIFLPTTHIEIIVTENDDLPLNTDYTVTIFQQPEFGRIEVIDATKGHFDYIRETDRARTDRFFYEICYDDCDRACEREMVTVEILYNDEECVTTNLISPNGDGTNDEFTIYCLENGDFPDNEVSIYNQWGDRVFRAAPYMNDWTGTFEGEDLPDGTYFYTFRRDANSEMKKGSLTIFR